MRASKLEKSNGRQGFMSPRKNQVTYSQYPTHAARQAHARGDKQFRTYDTSYIRPKQSPWPAIVCAIIAILVLVGAWWGITTILNGGFASEQKVELISSSEQATVTVASGAGASEIGQQLVDAGLISNRSQFTKTVNELDVAASLKPGTYTFAGGTSIEQIISQLCEGPVVSGSQLTIPEGSTLSAIADLVESATNGRITADMFKAAASDASKYASEFDFLADAGTNSLEGFLFPKTYGIEDNENAEDVVRKLLNQFKTETAALDWSYPQSQGLSIYEAVNLASIVEKESSGEEAVRAKVAAVFYNRLGNFDEPNYGFLQSDATTAYEVGHDPSAEEVHDENSAYSTYVHQGLPPTPISNPGLDCLMAVCSPDQDTINEGYYFFYFQSTDAGSSDYVFSKTYEEHQDVIANS